MGWRKKGDLYYIVWKSEKHDLGTVVAVAIQRGRGKQVKPERSLVSSLRQMSDTVSLLSSQAWYHTAKIPGYNKYSTHVRRRCRRSSRFWRDYWTVKDNRTHITWLTFIFLLFLIWNNNKTLYGTQLSNLMQVNGLGWEGLLNSQIFSGNQSLRIKR